MIKAGDLVMIVKPKPCCGGGSLGYVFVVADIKTALRSCFDCGHAQDETDALIPKENDWVSVSRLKKIDPPATGEYDRVPQRLKEPA